MLLKLRTFLLASLLLLLTGCSVLSSAEDVPRVYLLDIPVENAEINAESDGKTLLVSVPKAAPGYDTSAMLYIRESNILESYTLSQWVDTPARMLLPFLVQYLENSGEFGAILSAATTPVGGELQLDTEILRFQQVFLTEPSHIKIVMRAQLFDMQARQVVATKTFSIQEEVIASNDAKGGVLATNKVVQRLLEQITTFVVKNLAKG